MRFLKSLLFSKLCVFVPFLLLKHVPCCSHALQDLLTYLIFTSFPISPLSQAREERIVYEMV